MFKTILMLTVLDSMNQPITKAPIEIKAIESLARTEYGCQVTVSGDKIHVLDSCAFIVNQINKGK